MDLPSIEVSEIIETWAFRLQTFLFDDPITASFMTMSLKIIAGRVT